MFHQLAIAHWRQFNEIYIQFDRHMTVLTGPNGTGKTTILNVLSRHFGWSVQLVSTPLPTSHRREQQLCSDFWEMLDSETSPIPDSRSVGIVIYDSGAVCALKAPPTLKSSQYNLTYQGQENMDGLYVPSHRPPFSYQRVSSIPTDPKTSQQQYQSYFTLLQQLFSAEHIQNPAKVLKESLIALAVFGYGSEAVLGNTEYKQMFEQFQECLRLLLPRQIGFQKLEIRVPDIVLVTNSGDFSLDAASGGIGSIVGIAWQVFMYAHDKKEFIVVIDEPESHLHPSMQRELLPNLIRAFPQTQFIVATHSPFVATSSEIAKVYALTYDENRKVVSALLSASDLAGTANETLREILGVPLSVPVWVEEKLARVVEKYKTSELSKEVIRRLKEELVLSGLRNLFPDVIVRLGESYA